MLSPANAAAAVASGAAPVNKSSGRRNPKKSAFCCEPCRERKVKCGAEQPQCARCQKRGDDCVYKLSPTLSYTQRLEKQVANLEAALKRATQDTASIAGSVTSDVPGIEAATPVASTPTSSLVEAAVYGVDENGRKSLHGSTSLFELPGSSRTSAAARNGAPEQEQAARRASLLNNAWRERAFERLAEIPEPFRSLLDSHFCWIQPLFNFVYRPAFTRDMKTGGSYFSQALLNTILSHSVRWCCDDPGMAELLEPFNKGEVFADNAITYLFEDIRLGRNKIPTVQALLLLSARACGRGDRTHAWLYSGMAFRLIDDMGICVDSTGSGQMSMEDIEIRHRLFWGCYFWDKLISLYFGRSPMLQKSEISPPRVLMDDTAEIEPWQPHGLQHSSYPPRQAYSISCFTQMASLAENLNQILIHLYNPSREATSSRGVQCAQEEQIKMRDWWRDLPSHLKIDITASGLTCPPSHVVILNCLYHTINILLHRAMLKLGREKSEGSPPTDRNHPLIQCISSATSIVALYELYVRTFSDGHVVLSLAYSVYTAASIFLLEVQALGRAAPSTLDRLSLCVDALKKLQRTNPVMATAVGVISKELEASGLKLPERRPNQATRARNTQVMPQTFLPLLPVETPAPNPQASPSHRVQHPFSFYDNQLLDTSYMMDDNMDMNLVDIPPEMFEAFLQAEPISTTMNSGFDMY